MTPRYFIRAARHRLSGTLKKSKFITTLAHAASPEEARQIIAGLKTEFSDANHNCWAYVAGPPGDTAQCGMSDDGEPHGTAGKPMLNVLVHCDVGEIVAVVTRYFGGIKLGKGGLVRAYSGAVQDALDSLKRIEKRTWSRGSIVVGYKRLEPAKRLLAASGARVLTENYIEHVIIEYEVPEEARLTLAAELDRLAGS